MLNMVNRFEELIQIEESKPYFKDIMNFLNQAYQEKEIYPPRDLLFNSLKLCNYDDLKVVIMGQDPYHEPHQAMGLSFSVPEGTPLPPSLVNIYRELHDDIGCDTPSCGDLSGWASQGVLLLNSVLSVEKGQAASHNKIGWQTFTDNIIRYLDHYPSPLVFILWGKYAQSKQELIHNNQHLIIKSVHPSPLSAYRGFFGSKPFSQANAFLVKNHRKPIDWSKINAI